MKIKYFSGFSGIGGFDQGITQVFPDAECIGYSEIDKYAVKIYDKHFPDRTNYGNIKEINEKDLPNFDMLCGGFPCQDLSIAGKRAGLCGARSGLFFEIIRIIREKQPLVVFLENVKGLFSSNGGWDFARILLELDGSGYDVEWQCLNSKNFGVPQNRERVFIIGHLRGKPWKPVFPIRQDEKLSDKSDEGREQQETPISTTLSQRYTAESTYICIDGNGRMDKDSTGTIGARYYKGVESYGSNPFILEKHAGALTAGGHSGGLHSSMTLIQVGGENQADRVYSDKGLSKCLSNGGGQGAKTGLYVISDSGVNRKYQLRIENIAPLRANNGAGHNNIIMRNISNTVDTTGLLREAGHRVSQNDSIIRRLTPLECERLQGYPDGWTEGISDTQRYKCLGNAVTVNVIEAIVQRMRENIASV